MGILKLKNSVQRYPWGSYEWIQELLGEKDDTEPMAELWMGAHPKSPSMALTGEGEKSLDQLISGDPEQFLGPAAADQFGRLPFLFKVLAAGKPLSIQAHPDIESARLGFERENREGIAPDDFTRTYKDDNHKPEIICAVTPFVGLNGFMPYGDILSFFESLKASCIKEETARFSANQSEEGFREFFLSLMGLEKEREQALIETILACAEKNRETDKKAYWLLRISEEFPGDRGIISAALLNLVELAPGEAMYLPARQLHAYLNGLGMELMANSDNVLRGGLTPKYVNVSEMAAILKFSPEEVEILTPGPVDGIQVYKTPAREFQLGRISLTKGTPFEKKENHKPLILFCLEGEGRISSGESPKPLTIRRGESVFITASEKQFEITGEGTFYLATTQV